MVAELQTQTRPKLPATIPTELIWRLDVSQYHQMIETGNLTDDDPVELLEGLLVEQPSRSPPHTLTTQLTRDALAHMLPPGWFVNDQEPITTEDSEPEPDVVLVRGERHMYLERHPQPDEVALVIEVADSTLQRDRSTKKRLYARAGVAVYWIINLVERQIEVYNPTFWCNR